MNNDEIEEIQRVLDLVPLSPWGFHEGDDFDHWMIWSDDPLTCRFLVDGDDGVPPDKRFIEYVLKSRAIIEKLLLEVKKNQREIKY